MFLGASMDELSFYGLLLSGQKPSSFSNMDVRDSPEWTIDMRRLEPTAKHENVMPMNRV
jgi:hypothetical protein